MKFDLKQAISQRLQNKAQLISLLLNIGLWLFALLYLELLLHFAAFGLPDVRFLFVVGFSLVFACGIALLTTFLPSKAAFPVTILLLVLIIIVFGSQLVYYFAFGTLYSLGQVGQGGDAITSFWKQTLLTIWGNIGWVIAVFVPLIPPILLRIFHKKSYEPTNALWRCCALVGMIAIQLLCVGCLSIGGTGYFSNHYYYHSDLTTADQAAQRFGLLTALRLNAGSAAVSEDTNDYYIPQVTNPTTPSGEDVPTEPEYNVLDIDFAALSAMTDDEKLIAINDYCASLTGTNQNPYTGMLSDYNLIVLCAESFATGAIDPVLTPTLYRMANEGFVFTNYYNTYPNNTTDGEYTLCTGLYPDTSRGKKVASFYASRNSYLPYCLGNIFQQQKGVESFGYHNYAGRYYGRTKTHPNMGYTMKFAGDGMQFTTSWPASDLEMMEQSVGDYIGKEQFHAYYMTFSGHMSYDLGSNPMAYRNWDLVKDLDLSYGAKCYLSCNIELDKALAYLLARLEEEGVADRTAIVLAGDHFPYGLTDAQYSELVGYTIDHDTKFRSSLIFWVGGMEESVVVEEYCCNADILPTILNLWGFEYDSRMLAGTDIFSNGPHVAILTDTSFYTDKVWLNASTGQIRYLVPEEELPQGYVDGMIQLVKTKYSLSKNILNTAYYNFVFDQGSVSVNWGTWYTGGTKDPDQEEAKPTEPKTTEPKATEPKATEGNTEPVQNTEAAQVTTPQSTVPPQTGE